MAFNHYAKIKRILKNEKDWYIKRIDKPTKTKNFKGETLNYNYYYRIYNSNNQPIKYCKFQQLDRLAKILKTESENLPIIN